jgi:hypothetical protein
LLSLTDFNENRHILLQAVFVRVNREKMSDQEIITLDSDDEADASVADLVVGPTGTAVPIGEAQKHGLAGRLPLPPGIPSRPQPGMRPAPPGLMMGRNTKLPKKPGVFPPFALFSQERRDKVLQENKDISFTDVGKKMGELWHTLSEDEKEDYRKRAREIADRKLKEWHQKMKEFPQLASQVKYDHQFFTSVFLATNIIPNDFDKFEDLFFS